MIDPLRPVTRAVTYTRWLHLVMATVLATVFAFVVPGLGRMNTLAGAWLLVAPLPLLAALAVIPGVRLSEGTQAQLLLFPGRRDAEKPDVVPAPSVSWEDRRRTALWLVLRYELGTLTAFLSVHVPTLVVRLLRSAGGERPLRLPLTGTVFAPHWWYAPLAAVALALFAAFVVAAGALLARAARALLGPSAAARLAALEERTERLLEHNRLARELHDSVGHALTVAVVQAGAARAAGSPEFTRQALAAIEETGRHALEDLERMLRVLREDAPPPARRPSLADAERLLSAARGSGAHVTAEVTGSLEAVPGPVSREGYRIVQEALTNVVRHAGPVDVLVRIAVGADELELDVRNPLEDRNPLDAGDRPGGGAAAGGSGSGLRGIRERAALLGGRAETGEHEGTWRVRVLLPLNDLG
ncbi:sensor histidine kinase [Streptomyces griseocarneus]|uniref:sensor histidine kinase n=1 Tax=Streptomyces griseocarneus TaxID=51201 RepID=UPI00167CD3B6|nr:histidine kinase [Streptomyces griseocarneus]MBZ6477465.1 histidine kinase [Streptomyces griseocarneus]GHG49467.1 two-component sensor histidine kinase [Streptomyces griseocarneus]